MPAPPSTKPRRSLAPSEFVNASFFRAPIEYRKLAIARSGDLFLDHSLMPLTTHHGLCIGGGLVDPEFSFALTAIEAAVPTMPASRGTTAFRTTLMPYVRIVTDAFRQHEDLAKVKIAVSGAPVCKLCSEENSVDGYGAGAPSSAEMFLRFGNAA